jgi:diacylglycerol kinase (ATP)
VRPFQFTVRIRSFRHAINGILRMIRCQHNAWIHAAATVVAVSGAYLLRVSAGDWCWIILAISIVWTAEALNTAFEFWRTLRRQSFTHWFATRRMSRPVRCF